MPAVASKAVLITGCSTGIGRATAEHLARRGHTVYATARRRETVSDLEAAGCRTLALDVTDEASMQAATANVYKGPVSKLGGGPGAVAKTIEKAIVAEKPRTRYRVTPSAHLMINQRRVMTDRLWDRMIATQFPRPGKE